MLILSWNIQYGKGCDGHVSLERIASVIRGMGEPDVICLQEVSRWLQLQDNVPGSDQLAEIQRLFPDYEAIFGAAVEARLANTNRRWQFGNLMLTRLPVSSVFHHPLPRPADAGARHMPRQATELSVTLAARSVRIVNTHLEFGSSLQRTAQLKRLCELNEEVNANNLAPPSSDLNGPYQKLNRAEHCIICGDFNFGVDFAEYAMMLDASGETGTSFKDAWSIVHGPRQHHPTCGVFDQIQWPQGPHCRDFFFVTNGLSAAVYDVIVNTDTDASDHQPIMMFLSDEFFADNEA
ncbi:MAG: endonuclease/exonuclease/phosphatase family protein [Hyphomicrobiaceae bacterium]